MKYGLDYTTRWHDTDAGRNMRPSAILVYMQETSNAHLADAGYSLDALRDERGLAFILSKIRIAIHKPLAAYENIRVETWTVAGRGYSSTRCYRILSGDTVVVESDTVWALVDINKKDLCRFEEAGYSFEDEEPLSLNVPSRTRMPSDLVAEEVGKRKIVYSDLDYNMHMNNTRYPDMLCDFMPIEEVPKIRTITLSYLREASFGKTLTVLRAKKDNCYYFKTLGEDGGVCLEAVIGLEE